MEVVLKVVETLRHGEWPYVSDMINKLESLLEPEKEEFKKGDLVWVWDSDIKFKSLWFFNKIADNKELRYRVTCNLNDFDDADGSGFRYCYRAIDVPGILHRWEGGDNPYKNNPDAVVMYWMRRDGVSVAPANELDWGRVGESYDIIAFMLMPEEG